jgi:hypothetical protein
MRAHAVQPVLLWAMSLCMAAVPAKACDTLPQVVQPPDSIGPLGISQKGVLSDFQDQVLSRSVSQAVVPAGAATGFPTGRLGQTWHAPYVSLQPTPWPSYESRSAEGSVLASGSYNFPRRISGGSLQAGIFGGESWVRTTYNPASTVPGAKASNNSYLAGGYVLYGSGSNYVMNTVSIFEGTTGLTGEVFTAGSSSYGTHGFVDTVVAGHVFSLNGMFRPLNLDVRGGLLYSDAQGDAYADGAGRIYRQGTEEWTASLSATLFRDFAIWGGDTVRPYVKTGLKEQLSYLNKVEETFQGVSTSYRFGQSPTLGGAEIGFDYIRAGVTVSGAVFGEVASDQRALGGRLGAKIAF